jgi:hypothetical protein
MDILLYLLVRGDMVVADVTWCGCSVTMWSYITSPPFVLLPLCNMPSNQQTQVLKTFPVDHEGRVLPLSNLSAATELNLDEANLMIILVGEMFSFASVH